MLKNMLHLISLKQNTFWQTWARATNLHNFILIFSENYVKIWQKSKCVSSHDLLLFLQLLRVQACVKFVRWYLNTSWRFHFVFSCGKVKNLKGISVFARIQLYWMHLPVKEGNSGILLNICSNIDAYLNSYYDYQ